MNKIEKEVEDFLFANPAAIESDLRWVSRQRPVFWHGSRIGINDLVGVDSSKNLVIVELKADVLTSHVIGQMLGYYRCLSTHEGASGYRIIFVGQRVSVVFRVMIEWLAVELGIPMEVKLWSKNSDGEFVVEDYDAERHKHLSFALET